MAGNSSVLALRMNGVTGSTTFEDEIGKSVTNTGSVVITDSVAGPYTGSKVAQFNGSNCLTIPSSPDFEFGTGDFTIEGWYRTTSHASQGLFDGRTSSGDVSPIIYISGASTPMNITYHTNGSGQFNSLSCVPFDSFFHLALVRYSGHTDMYINGSKVGSGFADSYNYIQNPFTIGDPLLGSSFIGYVSDFHIIKGYAKYTSNFSVPTNYIPKYIQYAPSIISSVLHFDGVDGETSTTDETGKTWTFNGGASLSNLSSKYGTTSLKLDGTTGYLSTLANDDFNFGTGDFTFDFWFNPSSITGYHGLFFKSSNHFSIYTNGDDLECGHDSMYAISSCSGISINSWNHGAVCRKDGMVTVYLNGIPGTPVSYTLTVNFSGSSMFIGTIAYGKFNGYIDYVQVTKGSSSHNSSYILPNYSVPRMTGTYFDGDSGAKSLLHFNGTNGSTVITDEYFKSWTAYGGASISTANSKFGPSSLYLDGTTGYIKTVADSDFDYGTGDFTFDFWFNPSSITGYRGLIYKTTSHFSLYTNGDHLECGHYGIYGIAGVAGILINSWNHGAVCRRSGILTVYLNGIPGNLNTSYTLPVNFSGSDMFIGTTPDGKFAGYIDELKSYKGVCKYTIPFIPEDSQSGKYSLKLDMDDFTDATGKVITNNGVTISTVQYKTNGASAYFNGASYLSIPASTDFDMGTGDFSIGGWAYISANSPPDNDGRRFASIISVNDSSSEYLTLIVTGNSSTTGTGINFSNGTVGFTAACTVTKNGLHFISACRKSGVIYISLDGFIVGSQAFTAQVGSSLKTLSVGGRVLSGYNYYLNGYLDDWRIIKGKGLYTTDFTPPVYPDITREQVKFGSYAIPQANLLSDHQLAKTPLALYSLTDYTDSISSVNNTVLALHCDGTNGGTLINDLTGKSLTFSGGAALSNVNKKFGNTSLSFDGIDGMVSSPSSTDWSFGALDFTIECWFYIKGNSPGNFDSNREAVLVYCRNTGTTYNYGFELTIAGNSTTTGIGLFFGVYDENGSAIVVAPASLTISQLEWHHVAVSRSSGTLKVFIDGNQVHSQYNTANVQTSVNQLTVGSCGFTNYPNRFNGYIDDVRITKGTALYTANFTPPTIPFVYDSGSGTYVKDSSGNGYDAKAYGDLTKKTELGISGVYFGGNTSYIESPSISPLQDLSTGYTIEMLVNPDASSLASTSPLTIGNTKSSATNSGSIRIEKDGSQESYTDFKLIHSNVAVDQTALLSDQTYKARNGWKLLSFTHDSLGKRKVYCNGLLVNSDTISIPSIDSSRNRIMLGRSPGGTGGYTGMISSVAIYKTALSDAQVADNFLAFLSTSGTTVYDGIVNDTLNSIDASNLLKLLLTVGSESFTATDSMTYFYKQVTILLETISSVISNSTAGIPLYVQFGSGADSLVAVSNLLSRYGILATASSSLSLSDIPPSQIVNFKAICSEDLLTAGLFLLSFPADIYDGILLSEEGTVFLSILKTIVDNVSFSDTASVDRAILSTVSDTIESSDEFTLNGVYQAIISSHIILSTKGKQGETLYTGYAVNKSNSATSVYENFKFNSYAKVGNKYYGCADDGIYLLDQSDTDDGDKINAMFSTGLVDCGNSLKKSIDNAFLAIRTDGEVFLRVTADGSSYQYKLSRDNDGKYEGSRVKIGKGLRAVNWKFELHNDYGSDFDIDSMKLYPLILSRHGGGA